MFFSRRGERVEVRWTRESERERESASEGIKRDEF